MGKKFVIRLLLFLTPLLILYALPFGVLWMAGDLADVNRIIDLQARHDKVVVMGMGYSNPNKYYKLRSLQTQRPQVLVLGSSRTMQFRSKLVRPGVTFYTAGGSVGDCNQLSTILSRIEPGHEPNVIIVGLDQCFFNANPDVDTEADAPNVFGGAADTYTVFTTNFKKVYMDYFRGKYRLGDVCRQSTQPELVGMQAKVAGSGFRNDGSYRYGRHVLGSPEHKVFDTPQYGDVFEKVAGGAARFRYGQEISPAAIQSLGVFLETCSKRGIHVVAFVPPFASAVLHKMMSMDDKYAYIPKIMPALSPLFAGRGFTVKDFTDLATLGASEMEIIDGSHGSEKAYVRVFLLLAEADASLAAMADLPELRRKLAATEDPFDVFGDAM